MVPTRFALSALAGSISKDRLVQEDFVFKNQENR